MNLWKKGRQGSGYSKLTFLKQDFMDIHILRYPEGSCIDWHKDPIKGKKHYRINVVLKPPKKGGKFFSIEQPLFSFGPIVVFRPDKNEHMVSEIKKGVRYVLSIGFTRSDDISEQENQSS